jgi:dienelactone hydrolase
MTRRTLLVLALAMGCSSGADDAAEPPAVEGCLVPAPRVLEPEGLSRCNLPRFDWSTSATLGDVTERGPVETVSSSASSLVLAIGKVQTAERHEVQVQQIAYRTQDRGKLLDATTLVAWPSDYERRTTLDVVLVLHGTAGFTDKCAPSSSSDTRALASALASLGYVVVAPDYLGLKALGAPTGFTHPYLVAEPTALASLDAVRAGLKLLSRDEHACARPRFATMGGSQGGHAALWIDRLAPYYAQELTHVGVVATVPPADMLGESQRALTNWENASKNVAAFLGAASDWYGYRDALDTLFVAPWSADVPKAMRETCSPNLDAAGSLDALFTAALLDAGKTVDTLRAFAPVGCWLEQSGLTSTSVARRAPTYPGYGVLFITGEDDRLVHTPTERRSFQTLCSQGLTMEYLECAGAGHTQATLWSLPEITDFLRDRFAGRRPEAEKSCSLRAPSRCRGTP